MIWGVEDSTFLGLAGIIAGLVVGLGTALMSFWWSYKTRVSPHREFLYQKQIEAYIDLATNISCSLSPCYNFLVTESLTAENRKQFEEITEKAHDELWSQARMSLMILPAGVAEAVVGLLSALNSEAMAKLHSSKEAGLVLTKAEMAVYKAAHEWAGVEPLAEEMLRMFRAI